MQPEGYNPLRWDCQKSGCFNAKRRPKIEAFADCFPRRINFGDVDGMVELNGRFCFLEWKGDGGCVRRGQALSYMALTRLTGNIVMIVHGDAETMEVKGYSMFWQGKQTSFVSAGLGDLKKRISAWATWAEGQAAA